MRVGTQPPLPKWQARSPGPGAGAGACKPVPLTESGALRVDLPIQSCCRSTEAQLVPESGLLWAASCHSTKLKQTQQLPGSEVPLPRLASGKSGCVLQGPGEGPLHLRLPSLLPAEPEGLLPCQFHCFPSCLPWLWPLTRSLVLEAVLVFHWRGSRHTGTQGPSFLGLIHLSQPLGCLDVLAWSLAWLHLLGRVWAAGRCLRVTH